MLSIRCKWTGIRPLIMSNPQTVRVSCPYSIRSRELNKDMKAARKKEDANRMIEIEQKSMRNDWESSAYWSDELPGFVLPDTSIAACIRAGAAASKKGKDIDRAVIVNEVEIPVECGKRFRTLDEAWKDENFRLSGPCKIPPKTGALVWKCRCMIPTGWTITFSLDFDEKFILAKDLQEILINAGAVCGIGGWRPKFGRFLVSFLGNE